MFHVRHRARAARAAMTSLVENENALRGAEEIVRRAWARELLRRREYPEFELRAASDDEDAAHARLVSAQRDGAPWTIAAARAALERAVETTRASVRARDRMQRTLRAELDLLEEAARDHALSDLVRQMEHERSAIVAQGPDTPGAQIPRPASAAAGSRARLRLPRALRRLAASRAVRLEQP
jgi:hypothetical protein